jgi:hypothetical protein
MPVPTSDFRSRPTGLGAQPSRDPSIFESALDRLAETLDQVAPGARGELTHEFMMRNGYFDDPGRADALYQSAPEVDAYLDQLRLSKATDDANRGLTGEQVVAASVGFGLGLGVAYLVSSATSSPQRRLKG